MDQEAAVLRIHRTFYRWASVFWVRIRVFWSDIAFSAVGSRYGSGFFSREVENLNVDHSTVILGISVTVPDSYLGWSPVLDLLLFRVSSGSLLVSKDPEQDPKRVYK